jgi:hypothetical protein
MRDERERCHVPLSYVVIRDSARHRRRLLVVRKLVDVEGMSCSVATTIRNSQLRKAPVGQNIESTLADCQPLERKGWNPSYRTR